MTIDASAKALTGRALGTPYTFSFTTPTVTLLATNWYRRNRRFDEPLVVALRFNQPVRSNDVVPHVTMRYEKHAWTRPNLSPSARERLSQVDPGSVERFEAKVAAAARAAEADTPVPLALARGWDTRTFKPSPDLVVVQTTIVPPPESWIKLTVDAGVPSPGGAATPAAATSWANRSARSGWAPVSCSRNNGEE